MAADTERPSIAAARRPDRRPRGRPKGTSKIDPDVIVEAALDALADGGYTGLSMRGVARASGVSLATLQHHHPTKDALWRAGVDHLTAEAIERDTGVDPTDLAGRIESFLEQGGTRPGLLAALMSDRAPGSDERLDYIAERFIAPFAESDRRLGAFEEAGITRRIDRRALRLLFTVGIGSIAGSPGAVERIYGFDLSTERGRRELAAGLADIIGAGVLRR